MLGTLLDKVIFPKPNPAYLVYSELKAHELRLDVGQNLSLQGWRILNPKASNGDVGLYFGGNGEDVSQGLRSFLNLGFKVAYAFNYRGYGLSDGKPSQDALYADAISICDFISKHESGNLGEKLSIVGRSLGASVAVFASARFSVKSVVLITPFKNMRSLVIEKSKGFPVHWFLRQQFPSDFYAKNNDTPMLMVLAENDTLIPNRNSLELYRVWKGSKGLKIIKNAGHNDLHNYPEYTDALSGFLNISKAC